MKYFGLMFALLFMLTDAPFAVHAAERISNDLVGSKWTGKIFSEDAMSCGFKEHEASLVINADNFTLSTKDGYGNSRVHKLSPDGKHIKSWGVPGTENGEFSLPHSISMIGDDKVIVADRENFRLQIFSTDGKYLDQWHIHHPMSVTEGKNGDKNLYVGEMGPPEVQHGVPGLGNRIVILNPNGERITHFGNDLPGQNPDQFVAPHGVTTDSKGNVYVGEVAWTFWFSKKDPHPLGELVSLRKWIKK